MRNLTPTKIIAICLGAVIVVLAFAFTLRAQTVSDELFIFKNGTQLNYEVKNINGINYALTVTIDAMKPDLVFDWTKVGSVTLHKGHVTFHQDDFEKGRNILSDLKDGDDRSKSNYLWFSRNQLFELNTSGKTIYYLDANTKLQGMTVTAKEKMDVIVNGNKKTLDVIHAKNVAQGSTDEFWILNIKDNPLILKESISGNTFQIKQINL